MCGLCGYPIEGDAQLCWYCLQRPVVVRDACVMCHVALDVDEQRYKNVGNYCYECDAKIEADVARKSNQVYTLVLISF